MIRNRTATLLLITGTILLGLAAGRSANAQSVSGAVRAAPWDETCPVPLPEEHFTGAERWAWEQLCLGRIADMSQAPGGAPELGCDPRVANGEQGAQSWPDARNLSWRFLRTVLTHAPYNDALPRPSVYVNCARFPGTVSLSYMDITPRLSFIASRFEAPVYMLGTQLRNGLNISTSVFDRHVHADRMRVNGDVLARGGARFKSVVLMIGAEITGNLELDGAWFQEVLDADSIQIAGSVFLRDGAYFERDIVFVSARIGRDFQILQSRYGGSLDLTNTRIGGDLAVARGSQGRRAAPVWGADARLVLRNAKAGAIQDISDAWTLSETDPERVLPCRGQAWLPVDLIGFEYDRWGGLLAARGEIARRNVAWFVDWIECSEHRSDRPWDAVYTPQPYHQLADVLRKSGFPAEANHLLLKARDHQRRAETTPVLTKIGLSILGVTVGYGYRSWMALIWFAGLVLLGWLIAAWTPLTNILRFLKGPDAEDWAEIRKQFAFSFDKATPVLELDRKHKEQSFSGWLGLYFYLHQILGFLFLTLFLGGISGVIK